jgi:Ni/Co efflux regulator RcnB
MIARILIPALAVIAVPMAVHGAEGPRRPASQTKRTCEVEKQTGSRLGGIRRCRTAEEREAAKQEARQVVDRVQAWKPSFCTPPLC